MKMIPMGTVKILLLLLAPLVSVRLQIQIFLVKLLPLSGHSLQRITSPKSNTPSRGISIFYKSSIQLQFTNICSTQPQYLFSSPSEQQQRTWLAEGNLFRGKMSKYFQEQHHSVLCSHLTPAVRMNRL